jgi:hypothetical protein
MEMKDPFHRDFRVPSFCTPLAPPLGEVHFLAPGNDSGAAHRGRDRQITAGSCWDQSESERQLADSRSVATPHPVVPDQNAAVSVPPSNTPLGSVKPTSMLSEIVSAGIVVLPGNVNQAFPAITGGPSAWALTWPFAKLECKARMTSWISGRRTCGFRLRHSNLPLSIQLVK